MKLTKTIALYLGNLDQAVVTDYELCNIFVKIFVSGEFDGEKIDIRTDKFPDNRYYHEKLKSLIDSGVLDQHSDFPENRVFRILGKKGFEVGDIACSVDPFAYISHLSAMAFHGITDRVPSMLIISSPDQRSWSMHASAKMKSDLKGHIYDYRDNGLPLLKKLRFHKINKNPVERVSSIHHGAFKTVRGRSLRVATIGRTFLDMVRVPGLCGGIRHVVDVFKEFGGEYASLIIDE